MRWLITGARGFIGRQLVRDLSARHEVLAPSRQELDLLDAAAVRRYLRDHPVDVVVHAATTPGHRNAPPVPDLYERNLRMFSALAECGEWWRRMVVLGSGSEYDASRPLDLVREEALGEQVPADPTGRSKLEISRRCEGDPRFTVLRLFGVYGPGEDWEIRFVSNAICKALSGRPVTLRQDRRFHYLWVEDLAPVLERVAPSPTRHASYNVVPPEVASLAALARRVVARAGRDLPIVVERPGEGLPYTGSGERLARDFPGLRFTPSDAAIERLWRWYVEHRHEIREDLLASDK
jgi:GDP-L-fucose synthase